MFLQANGNSVPVGATLVQAFTSNITAGSTITVWTSADASPALVGIADTLGNAYTLTDNYAETVNNERIRSWVAKSPTGGANTVTVTLASAPGDGTIIVCENSGRDTTTPTGGHTTNDQATPGTGANGITCGPINVVAGDDVLMFMVDTAGIHANGFTAGTGFTERKEVGSGGGSQLDSMLQSIDNASANAAFSGTATTATNERIVSVIIALKAAAGGGGSVLFKPYFTNP